MEWKHALGIFNASMAVAGVLAPVSAVAVPITVTQPFHILDNRSPNSVNTPAGLRQQFGAVSVVPNGNAGTTGVARQGTRTISLAFFPFSTLPNFFSSSREASTVPDGPWTLTFTNGSDTASAVTPSIAGATTIPFVSAMTISGGPTPTFNWQLPTGAPLDAVRIQIRDTTNLRGTGGVGGGGVADIIYSQGFPATTTSFTVNPSDPGFVAPVLPDRQYTFEVTLRDLRNPTGGTGIRNTLSESTTFFDFTLLPSNAPPEVHLPLIDTSGPVPIHRFTPIPVTAGELIFIDPLVAVGYDYQIGQGNPNFASVLLPTVGDNMFDLWLWSGTDWFDTGTDLLGGDEFLFAQGGVDRFRITGIEVEAGVDPFSPTGFITGVSFVSDGFFDGTMTPLVVDVAQVPEPSTLALLLAAVAIVTASRSRNFGKSSH